MRCCRNKNKGWAGKVRCGRLQPADAWHGMQSTMQRSVEHSIAATCFTSHDCKNMMELVLNARLHASKAQSQTLRALSFGPISKQGLKLPELHLQQTTEHLEKQQRDIKSNWEQQTDQCGNWSTTQLKNFPHSHGQKKCGEIFYC